MKWRCKKTGNVIEVPESETENMKQMEHYEPLKEDKKTLSLPKKESK